MAREGISTGAALRSSARKAFKGTAKAVFSRLPFGLQLRLARNNPAAAFYIDKRPRHLTIDYYLGRYTVEIDTEVDIQRRMLSGSYEPETQNVIDRLVRPGFTCVDIGANVGAITLKLADIVGPTGRVEAFEPGPQYFERLRKNISLNPSLGARVGLHQVGLSDRPGKLKWQASRIYIGTASMYPGVHDPAAPTLELPVERLDDYEPIQKLERVDFMKLDVDGLEREILRGGEGLLRRHRPTLYVETTLWNEEMRQAASDIERFLLGLGYELYKVEDRTGALSPTRFPDFSFNTVALHSQRRAP
jgi:FkbM family methyltransferase